MTAQAFSSPSSLNRRSVAEKNFADPSFYFTASWVVSGPELEPRSSTRRPPSSAGTRCCSRDIWQHLRVNIGEQRLQMRRQLRAVATGRRLQVLRTFQHLAVIVFDHFELHDPLSSPCTAESTLRPTPLEIKGRSPSRVDICAAATRHRTAFQ